MLFVCFFSTFYFFIFSGYFCRTVSHQNLVLKFCGKSPLPTCNYKYQFGLLRTTLRNEITHEIFFFLSPLSLTRMFPKWSFRSKWRRKNCKHLQIRQNCTCFISLNYILNLRLKTVEDFRNRKTSATTFKGPVWEINGQKSHSKQCYS